MCPLVVGRNKHQHNEQTPIEILDKIQDMKDKLKAINNTRTTTWEMTALAECIEANNQVNRSMRDVKNKYLEFILWITPPSDACRRIPSEDQIPFILVIPWIMRTSICDKKCGVKWTR